MGGDSAWACDWHCWFWFIKFWHGWHGFIKSRRRSKFWPLPKNNVVLNALLFNEYRIFIKNEYRFIVPTVFNCNLQLFFVMLNLIRPSYTQMKLTCVKCIFKFIWWSSEKRGKEKQKIAFNSKKQFGKGSFVY